MRTTKRDEEMKMVFTCKRDTKKFFNNFNS